MWRSSIIIKFISIHLSNHLSRWPNTVKSFTLTVQNVIARNIFGERWFSPVLDHWTLRTLCLCRAMMPFICPMNFQQIPMKCNSFNPMTNRLILGPYFMWIFVFRLFWVSFQHLVDRLREKSRMHSVHSNQSCEIEPAFWNKFRRNVYNTSISSRNSMRYSLE